ncbi:MAG TPA: hypothetical protein VHQ93_18755 [Chitinophagaceae bacterium]|jgi:hypothetical protein|nr:hypothetical protein [Chitinophagaceae bacterium]
MNKLYEDGTDIFQILDAIEKKTGLFILNRNLDYLYSFVSGYKFLAAQTKTEIKNLDKLDQFSLFLKEELNEEYENTMGWFGQLHSEFGSKEGFEKFFEYLHKYRTKNGF